MLVLARRHNQRIVIDDNIVITVVEFRGDKVRLGITAPPEVSVHREEVWLKIRAADQAEDSALCPP